MRLASISLLFATVAERSSGFFLTNRSPAVTATVCGSAPAVASASPDAGAKVLSYFEAEQMTWASPKFWAAFSSSVPHLESDPALERFRGFIHNLRTEVPGDEITLPNGQQLLRQYVYPGLPSDATSRAPLPRFEGGLSWLSELGAAADAAAEELHGAITALPLFEARGKAGVKHHRKSACFLVSLISLYLGPWFHGSGRSCRCLCFRRSCRRRRRRCRRRRRR